MSARPRSALSLLFCVFAAFAGSACGNSPAAPASTGHIVIQAAIRNESAPALGSVVRLNVDVRDASGTSVVSLLTVPVTQADSTFRVEVDGPVGEGQEVTVLAIGDRPVAGGPFGPETGIGVIYRGVATGVNVNAQAPTSRTVTLSAFVPQFAPLEALGSSVRISWSPVPGAQSYLLTRFYDDVGLTARAVAETSLVDDTGASRYQLIAVEKSGRHSAPSDFLEGQQSGFFSRAAGAE